MSVLSWLYMLRTNFQLQPRVFVDGSPQFAVTLTYFWDAALAPTLMALLDPAMMKEQLKGWLALDVHRCYALDWLSGGPCGPWYSANDVSMFDMLQTYVRVTGDFAFLKEKAGDKTIFDHMKALATYWRRLVGNALLSSLADYGGAENLLECVPTYVHRVASLNAANVGMMRSLAVLAERRGDTALARELREDAEHLSKAVVGLYMPGEGAWHAPPTESVFG